MAKISGKAAPKKEAAKKPMKRVMKSKKPSQNAVSKEKVKKEVKPKPAVVEPRVEEKCGKLDENFVKCGIQGLRAVIAKNLEEKKELFDGEQPIYMQINLVKIPKCPARIVHFPLTHSLATAASEICLIVPDMKEDEDDYEKAVKHYENLLEKKNVTAKVQQIMPLKQLRKEYSEFESKRKLAQLYDFFLVDGRIQGYVLRMMGNALTKAHKDLLSVKLQVTNLNDLIKKSMNNVSIKIHSRGNAQVINVGHTDMTDEQILENIMSAFAGLEKHLPGGSANVRSLMLKASTSLAIPIYLSLKSNSDVKVPIVIAPKTKKHKVVKDELSTHKNTNVVVYPSGDVKTVPINEKRNTRKAKANAPEKGSPKKPLAKSKRGGIQKRTTKVLQKPIKSKKKAAIKENIKGILKETNSAQPNRRGAQNGQAKTNGKSVTLKVENKGKKANVTNGMQKKTKAKKANNSMEKKGNQNKKNVNKSLEMKTNEKKTVEKKTPGRKPNAAKNMNAKKTLEKKTNGKKASEKKTTVQKVLTNKRKTKNKA